ncbi:MAG: flagellar biosynthetic protein FliR [Bryobacteraceae bacterium]
MHVNPTLPLSTLFGFLLVLARIGGAFVFVPIPGIRVGPAVPRIVLAMSITLLLFPQWPQIDAAGLEAGALIVTLLGEMIMGMAVGLGVSFVMEAFTLAAQVLGLQAGYAFASTVDPTTQADTGILLVFAQLIAGLLFFALGFHGEIVRIFARSLTAYPPGSFAISKPVAAGIAGLGADMFSTALRLSFPVIGLLVLMDLALALLGRVNAQLQLLMLAFPMKMLVSLTLLGMMAVMFPAVFRNLSGRVLVVLRHTMGI